MQSEHEKRPARKGRDILMTIGVIALIVAAIVVLGGGFLHGGMMGRGYMGPGFGPGYYFSPWPRILMSLFWLLVIAGVVLLIVSFTRRGQVTGLGPGPSGSRALEILKERYAKGEITRDQYEEMRRDIVD
jgi:putative membrane protein